jgi:NAD(P)H-dependent flavin oxidoreductase YrpB (nitropropane dioxygenase family)
MIRTAFTELLGIEHPIVSAGMGGGHTGTRFLSTDEAPVEDAYKDAIVASAGDDTVVTTVGDTLSGRDWPGAWARVKTRFVEEWLGREPELRRRRVLPAADVVREIVEEAEIALRDGKAATRAAR